MALERNELYETLRERIRIFLTSKVGEQMAQELTQQVLLVMWRKYADKTSPEEAVKIAVGIGKKLLLARFRDSRPIVDTPVDEIPLADSRPLPGDEEDENPQVVVFREFLTSPRCTEQCRKLFQLDLAGIEIEQVMTRMNTSSKQDIFNWRHRCRKTAKEFIWSRISAHGGRR